MRTYRAAFAQRFPELPAGFGEGLVQIPAYTAVEALLTALEKTDGELGSAHELLRSSLERLVLDAPQGTVRLDRQRQASEAIYLERIEPPKRGAGPRTRPLRRLDGVEQTFGGIFGAATPSPSKTDPTCERRPAPPWTG